MNKTKLLFGVLAATFLVLAAILLFRTQQQGQKRNVIVLLIDTVRADHLSFFGYERDTSPFLTSLAKENTLYTFCNAAAPWTPASVASLFTGLYPAAHGMMPPKSTPAAAELVSTKLSDGVTTMAEIFRDNGYETAAIMNNPWLKISFGYDQGFNFYEYHNRVHADEINKAAFKMLQLLKAKEQPFFLYVHYMDAHNPYNPPAEYRNKYTGNLQNRDYPPRAQKSMNAYDGAINYLDSQLAEFFSYLKEEGLYQDSVVLVVADHGEQFMEHGHSGHGFNLYNEELHVPCILKYDQRSRVVDTPVSLVDFLPTLAEITGLPTIPPVQGHSLLSGLAARVKDPILAEIKRIGNYKAVIDPQGTKLINTYEPKGNFLLKDDERPQLSECYQSQAVAIEEQPLDDPARKAALEQSFLELYRRARSLNSGVPAQTKIDVDTAAELKSLGYL